MRPWSAATTADGVEERERRLGYLQPKRSGIAERRASEHRCAESDITSETSSG